MQDVRKAFHMFEKVRVPSLGVVENMSYFEDGTGKRHHLFGKDGGKLLAKKLGADFLGEVPIVQAIREGGDEGRPLVVRDPSHPTALALRDIARRIAQRVSVLASHGQAGPEAVQIGSFN